MKHGIASESFVTGVAFGRAEALIEAFAERTGIPFTFLAARVGSLLQGAANGQVLGANHSMPTLRRKTRQRSASVEPLALDGGTHSDSQVEIKKAERRRYYLKHRDRILQGMKDKRKARTFTPDQKAAASVRMRMMNQDPKFKAAKRRGYSAYLKQRKNFGMDVER